MHEPKKLYLVDDDEDDRFLVCEALRLVASQITVVEATDGMQLFEVLDLSGPQFPVLILLDVNMPRMNGMETLAKIKSEVLLASVPIVMYSTSDDPEMIKLAYDDGITAFIAKPRTFEGYIEFAARITTFCK